MNKTMKAFTKKQTGIPILTVIFVIIAAQLTLSLTGIDHIQYQDISDQAVGVITDQNGSVAAENVDVSSWNLDPEDTLTITLDLPDQEVYEGGNAIVFFTYNAEIKAYYGEKELTEVGTGIAEEGRLIGHEMVHFDVPDDAWGKSITIELVSREKTRSSFTTAIRLMPSADVRLSPLIGHGLAFVLFFLIAMMSLVIFLQYLFEWLLAGRKYPGIFLFLFCLLVSIWYLGYNEAFFVFSAAERFNALAEYYAIYTAFIPLMIYFAMVSSNERFARFSRIMAWLFAADAAVSIALSFSASPLNLSDLMIFNRLLIGVMMAGIIIRGISIIREKMSAEKVVLSGLAVSSGVALLELIAIMLRSVSWIPAWLQPALYVDYASIGILLFIIILFVTYITEIQNEREMKIRQEELRRLAFVDQLTGIPNRAFLSHKIREMKEIPEDIAVVFMDVDHLKMANDVYGHETGDRLIRVMAQEIEKAYVEAGGQEDLYGRWGGDEFVAVFAAEKEASEFTETLIHNIQEINRKHQFPFPCAVSIGTACGSTNEDGTRRTIKQLLDMADQRMYRNKAVQHVQEAAAE